MVWRGYYIHKNNPHWRRHVIIEEETVKSSIDQIKCNYTHIDLMTEHPRLHHLSARALDVPLPLNFNGEVELFFCTLKNRVCWQERRE
jgi:hypothetical protein